MTVVYIYISTCYRQIERFLSWLLPGVEEYCRLFDSATKKCSRSRNFIFCVRNTAFGNRSSLSNDYLCGIEEVGFVGFLIVIFSWLLVCVSMTKGKTTRRNEPCAPIEDTARRQKMHELSFYDNQIIIRIANIFSKWDRHTGLSQNCLCFTYK